MGRIRVEWRYGALYGGKLLKGKGDSLSGQTRFASALPHIIVEYLDLTTKKASDWSLSIVFALGEPKFADDSIARANRFPL
jgi:hypothetical protein